MFQRIEVQNGGYYFVGSILARSDQSPKAVQGGIDENHISMDIFRGKSYIPTLLEHTLILRGRH